MIESPSLFFHNTSCALEISCHKERVQAQFYLCHMYYMFSDLHYCLKSLEQVLQIAVLWKLFLCFMYKFPNL